MSDTIPLHNSQCNLVKDDRRNRLINLCAFTAKIYYSCSRAVLQHFGFQEYVKQVLRGQGLRQPSWYLNVKFLFCRPLSEHFLEFIDQILILLLQLIELRVLVLNFPFLLFQLMPHGVGLVFVNTIQLIDLFLSSALCLFGLVLDQRVELFLLGIPTDGVLSQLPTKLLL